MFSLLLPWSIVVMGGCSEDRLELLVDLRKAEPLCLCANLNLAHAPEGKEEIGENLPRDLP